MPKPPVNAKAKNAKKNNKKQAPKFSKRLVLIGLFIVLISTFAILWSSLFKAYPIEGKKQMLSITSGETYSGFIDRLAKEDKVSFPIVLKLYQKFMIHDSMKAGVYEIEQGMSVRQVLEMLSDADNAQMNRVLVIEGTTFKQLITALKNDKNVKNTILDLPNDQLMKALGIPYNHPEGLFAPNLPYKDKYEALIMASIVEKETSLDSELTQVSGVFVRRLKLGMRLQTDPTVIYGMGNNYKGNITREDLRTPTPYNTYTINGLPPTPIALPSQKAIEAALHPDDSNNIYFVATGNGGHKFTADLQAHNQAVQEYLSVLRSKK